MSIKKKKKSDRETQFKDKHAKVTLKDSFKLSKVEKTPKLGQNFIVHSGSCPCTPQILVLSLSQSSKQRLTSCTPCAAITKYSRGELKMAFQPLTEFPTFLQFTPDPYVIPTHLSSDSTQSSGFWHCCSDTQPDVHMHTSMNYCIAKLPAQSLIICFQEDYRAAPSHAAPLCSPWPRNAGSKHAGKAPGWGWRCTRRKSQ